MASDQDKGYLTGHDKINDLGAIAYLQSEPILIVLSSFVFVAAKLCRRTHREFWVR